MRFFLIAAAAVSLVAAAPTAADNPQLVGSVGPGYVISLSSGGAAVNHLDAGTYTLVVHDLADVHNFHLFGPGGVNVATEIEFMGDKTFTVTLTDGIYNFNCDAHPTMSGKFAVGSAQLPTDTTPKPTSPAPRKLSPPVPTRRRATAPAHPSAGPPPAPPAHTTAPQRPHPP